MVEYTRTKGTRCVTIERDGKCKTWCYALTVDNSEGTTTVKLSRKELDWLVSVHYQLTSQEGRK